MNNDKQSSVELFIEQLEEKGGAWENVSIRRLNISIDVSDYMELKQQAKAKHKEEFVDFALFYTFGRTDMVAMRKYCEKLYDEKFNND